MLRIIIILAVFHVPCILSAQPWTHPNLSLSVTRSQDKTTAFITEMLTYDNEYIYFNYRMLEIASQYKRYFKIRIKWQDIKSVKKTPKGYILIEGFGDLSQGPSATYMDHSMKWNSTIWQKAFMNDWQTIDDVVKKVKALIIRQGGPDLDASVSELAVDIDACNSP